MPHGVIMLTEQDKQWFRQYCRNFTLSHNKISGELNFTATYNKETGDFLIIHEDSTDYVGGLHLNGKFKIRIEEREEKLLSKLPALYVDGVEPIADRHFGQRDKSACLCSPLEEESFLVPKFEFKKYFEQLVIPFLYGQVFYTTEKHWPWDEFKHGGIGLLQSYEQTCNNSTSPFVENFLNYLKQDARWPAYKKILILTRPSRQACPCGTGKKLRDCHPEAIKGLAKLKADISNLNINFN